MIVVSAGAWPCKPEKQTQGWWIVKSKILQYAETDPFEKYPKLRHNEYIDKWNESL